MAPNDSSSTRTDSISLAKSRPSTNDMNLCSSKRARMEIPMYLQHLWELTWGADGDVPPFCIQMEVKRDNSLPADMSPPVEFPSSCWIMQPPKKVTWTDGISGVLIRDDYIVALEYLFKAAGLDDPRIREHCPERSFTNLSLMSSPPQTIPNTKASREGWFSQVILEWVHHIMLYIDRKLMQL